MISKNFGAAAVNWAGNQKNIREIICGKENAPRVRRFAIPHPWEICFCVKGKYHFLLLPKVLKLLFGILPRKIFENMKYHLLPLKNKQEMRPVRSKLLYKLIISGNL